MTDRNRPVIPRLEPEKTKGYNFTHPSCECRWEPVTASEAMSEFIELHSRILQENYPNSKVEIMVGTLNPTVVATEMIGGELHIHGVLAIAGISHNRRIYLPEQLAKGNGQHLHVIFNHATPIGIEMEMPHLPEDIQEKIMNYEKIDVGETDLTWEQEKLTLFHDTVIKHPFFIKEINAKRMSVSLGMIFEDTAEPVCDEVCYTVVKEGRFQEMSLVYHAGFPHATIEANEAMIITDSAKEIGGAPPNSYLPYAKTVDFKTNKERKSKKKQMESTAKEDQYKEIIEPNTSTTGDHEIQIKWSDDKQTDTLMHGNIPDIKFRTVVRKSLYDGLEQYKSTEELTEAIEGVEAFYGELSRRTRETWLDGTANPTIPKYFQGLNQAGQDKILEKYTSYKNYNLPRINENSSLSKLLAYEFRDLPTEIRKGLKETTNMTPKIWREMKIDHDVRKSIKNLAEFKVTEAYEVRGDKGLIKRTENLLFAKLLAEKANISPSRRKSRRRSNL